MPTVQRIGPYRMFFYSDEGSELPHIHIQRERMLAKFWLAPVVLASSSGFGAREVRELERLVFINKDRLIEAWHEFFGA